jgi:predicted amidohydrolase YtcJ
MKKHGITAAQQPNFLYTLQQRYVANVDPQVRAHLIPVSTPMRAGINVSFGSDDLPIGPMLGLYAAVTRKGPNGERLGPSEAVSIRDAIRMYTLNTAYLTFDEKQKGSLEPGKLADFVVLDRDPLTIPSDQIKDIRVDMTAVGGRILYGREGTRWANLARTR